MIIRDALVLQDYLDHAKWIWVTKHELQQIQQFLRGESWHCPGMELSTEGDKVIIDYSKFDFEVWLNITTLLQSDQ